MRLSSILAPIGLALCLAAGLAPGLLPLAAQETHPAPDSHRPLPLQDAARLVSDRYLGRLIAAETRPASPHERDLGAMLVYEFRLLTPQRQMLLIRVDPRDGRFLEVAGRGQIEALRTGAIPDHPRRSHGGSRDQGRTNED